jgi:Helix-turn-helix domain
MAAVIDGSDGPAPARAPIQRSQKVNGSRTIEAVDYAGMISRCLRAMGRRAGEADPESLRLFARLRDDLDAAEHAAVSALLAEGYSWRDMGKAVGQNHTAVFNRYQRYEGKTS